MLAVRPRWREGLGLAFTALLTVSVPLTVVAATDVGRRMDQAERAAETLGELAPRAEQVASTTAEVARRLAAVADDQGPLLTEVADDVHAVVAELDDATDLLVPVASALDRLAPLVGDLGGPEAGDGLGRAGEALREVDRAVAGIAAATGDIAGQVAVLTSPETIALLEHSADAIDGVAELSRTAGDLADGYVARAGAYRTAAQVIAVLGLAGTLGWLVWRVREHRRWSALRRRNAAAGVLAAVAA